MKKTFENIVEKVENAGNQHFILFPQCFLPYQRQITTILTFNLLSANIFNLFKASVLSFCSEVKEHNFEWQNPMFFLFRNCPCLKFRKYLRNIPLPHNPYFNEAEKVAC